MATKTCIRCGNLLLGAEGRGDICNECLGRGWGYGHDDTSAEYERQMAEEADDDPQCVCGVYRSEHALLGCREGFQSPQGWASEREFIRSLDDDEYEAIYGWEG